MWVPPITHVEDLLLPGNARRYSRHELKKDSVPLHHKGNRFRESSTGHHLGTEFKSVEACGRVAD